jgi:hypothetical protein
MRLEHFNTVTMEILYLDKEPPIPSYWPTECVHIGNFDFILDTKWVQFFKEILPPNILTQLKHCSLSSTALTISWSFFCKAWFKPIVNPRTVCIKCDMKTNSYGWNIVNTIYACEHSNSYDWNIANLYENFLNSRIQRYKIHNNFIVRSPTSIFRPS